MYVLQQEIYADVTILISALVTGHICFNDFFILPSGLMFSLFIRTQMKWFRTCTESLTASNPTLLVSKRHVFLVAGWLKVFWKFL